VISLIVLAVMTVLMALRVPVDIAIGAAAAVGVLLGGFPLEVVPRMVVEAVDSFPLLAVPFFVLAGNLLNIGGVTDRIYNFARPLFAPLYGGVAQVNVGANMILSGMSGSALADLAGLGTIQMRAMRQAGYSSDFAIAVSLAACTVGPIIPPSISFVVYSMVTGVSTGRLFLAGIIPGIIMGLCIMGWICLIAIRTGAPHMRPEPFRLAELLRATYRGSLALLLPFVIIGSMIKGWATVTEAGAVAAIYALALGFIYGEFTWPKLKVCLIESTLTTALVMYVIAVSGALSWIITADRTVHEMAQSIAGMANDPLIVLLVVNLFLLVVGMLIEPLPALMICSAIFFPMLSTVGIDPVHFGVIISVNLIIGIITPPLGIGLFVASRVSGLSVEAVLNATAPFLIPLFISLAIITAFPILSTWLPDFVFGAAK
jgi:tripartite ATP-independent transporter DctM subunit